MRMPMLFTVAVAGIAAPLLAADAPPAHPRPSFERMAARHAEHEAKRAADIALLLGLRADQKPALDAFLKTIEPPHDHGPGGPDGEPHAPPPAEAGGTLARLDHMSHEMDAHVADAKQRIDATRRFYAGLTPEQQQRFDALERLKHDHGGMHGPHGPDGPPPRD